MKPSNRGATSRSVTAATVAYNDGLRNVLLLIVMVLVSGCTLGHKSFKENTVRLGGFPECQEFEDVFETRGEEGRLFVSDEDTNRALVSNVCVGKDISEGKRMSLAVIEFDDEGNHWDRKQFLNAMEEIRLISGNMENNNGPDPQRDIKSDTIFLVVYVHGWRNNASENVESLSRFRWFINQLANSDRTCFRAPSMDTSPSILGQSGTGKANQPCRIRPHVFGVYIAWRGDAVGEHLRRIPGAEYLTFWNRMSAARRIAGTAVTETLLGLFDSLEAADRRRFDIRREEADAPLDAVTAPPRSRSLVIGHSMGARILEYAFAQSFLAKRMEARRSYGTRLLQVLSEIDDRADQLGSVRNQLNLLDSDLSVVSNQVKDLDRTIEENKREIAQWENRLLDPDNASSLDDRLQAYANFWLSQVDETTQSCAAYMPSRVDKCTNGSEDIRIQGFCAASEVQCLYDTYRCSINRLISRRPLEMQDANCVGKYTALETTPPEGEEVDLWQKFADDLEDRSKNLSSMLSNWGYKSPPPLRTIDSILADDALFESGSEALGTMVQWHGDVSPLFFAPFTLVRDVTEIVEDRLLGTLGSAEDDIKLRIDLGKKHLSVARANKKLLGEEYSIRKEIKRLQIEMEEKQKERESTLQQQLELEKRRKAQADEENIIAGKLKVASDEVPFALDGALHPPGDVVLFINAATEAMSARKLIQAMCLTRGRTASTMDNVARLLAGVPGIAIDRPWIVSVTSEGDLATKVIFPLGVRFSRLLGREAHREFRAESGPCEDFMGSYGDLVARTAGHHPEIWSHEVESVSGNQPAGQLVFEVGNSKYVMREKSEKLGAREYWVAKVPEEIVKGHSDIINERTLGLAIGLLAYNQVFVSWCPRYEPPRDCRRLFAVSQATSAHS